MEGKTALPPQMRHYLGACDYKVTHHSVFMCMLCFANLILKCLQVKVMVNY